ncbi:MAG: alginate lyase family protein [Opitutaceae bacterium]|nr:alginate lyase family protein [Opitutaceae bacterium]
MPLRPILRFTASAVGALVFVAALTARGDSPAPARPSDWRDQTTLTHGWQFVRGELGGIWETLRSDDRALNLPVWTPVSLPHCVNATDSVDPDAPYYQGPMWYRTELEIYNPHQGGRTLLHFEGAGQKTQVWIGDQRVAEHVGGYAEFVVDITEAVAAYRASPLARLSPEDYRVTPGRVPLAVRCDNSRDLELIPSALSDFSIYGGLYRPVHLVHLPEGGLTRVHVAPTRAADGTWNVAVSARFAVHGGTPTEQQVDLRVLAADGAEVARARRTAVASAESQTIASLTLADVQLWSPRTPALYTVEVTARGPGGVSAVRERFGLRWFEFVERGPFKLNGERLLLRGTHRHEDHAGTAAAMTPELQEAEMRLMKDMGVNFIRLGHYQQSRRILELCDELGILVWEEIPWCRGGLGGEGYREQARAALRAMIDQHRNHPSVILWGLGNENDWPGDHVEFDKAKIRAFMQELHNLAHRLDPSRLTSIRRCDFCKDIVDVYSPSIWAGWYRGRFTEYKDVSLRAMQQVKHYLHVEWGGDSHAGRHAEDPYRILRDVSTQGEADERGLDFKSVGGDARASKDGDWSETYLCDLVDWHLKEQETMDWLTGTAMWPFKDFSTPLRPENPVPFVNQKGAVERDLTPKESFYVYQSYWSEKPMLHIYGHSWPVRWGKPGEKRWVKVYSNSDEVELWLNDVSQGTRRRDSQDFPAAGLRWDLPFEDGVNTLRAVGRRGTATVTDSVTFRYETRRWGAPHHLRLQELPAPDGRARVQLELLDAAGVVCLDSAALVRWAHAGDGRLRDNLGTAGGARAVQLANGRARIDLDLPPGGRATVSARLEGVPTALIHLQRPADSSANEALRAATPADIAQRVIRTDHARIVRLADLAMTVQPITLRSAPPPAQALTTGVLPGDFYSMGDYWWPNPKTPDGLPYVSRDGETNPDNFVTHRMLMRDMRDAIAALAAAYVATGDAAYAQRAARWLEVFFVDPATRMNPHLRFAQAVPGVSTGRSWGLIDTLHLAEVPLAAEAIAAAPGVPRATIEGVRGWFGDYLRWLLTDKMGIDEGRAKNNHSVAYWLQVAVFARFVGDTATLEETRRITREVLLPRQLAADGSFPRELARTKPYGYSIFQLDNVALLIDVLATPQENLWHTALPDGRSVRAAVDFLVPYLADRSAWPYPRDVAHFDAWPARQPVLLLAAYRLGRPDCLALWERLDPDPADLEVRRNIAVTQPLLWVLPR